MLLAGRRSASRCLILMVNSGPRRHTKMQLHTQTHTFHAWDPFVEMLREQNALSEDMMSSR